MPATWTRSVPGSSTGVAVYRRDHIARLQARLRAGAVRLYACDCNTPHVFAQAEALGQIGIYRLQSHADIAAAHFAGLHHLVHDVAGQIHRDGKADALIAAAVAGQNRGVDSDQFAARVDQRAARVAGLMAASV